MVVVTVSSAGAAAVVSATGAVSASVDSPGGHDGLGGRDCRLGERRLGRLSRPPLAAARPRLKGRCTGGTGSGGDGRVGATLRLGGAGSGSVPAAAPGAASARLTTTCGLPPGSAGILTRPLACGSAPCSSQMASAGSSSGVTACGRNPTCLLPMITAMKGWPAAFLTTRSVVQPVLTGAPPSNPFRNSSALDDKPHLELASTVQYHRLLLFAHDTLTKQRVALSIKRNHS